MFKLFVTSLLLILTCGLALAAGPGSSYTAAEVITDIKGIKTHKRVPWRLQRFILRWQNSNDGTGDLKSSVGWRLCKAMRQESQCYSGDGNILDHTIGWGLCMASGRPQSDCFAGTHTVLDQYIGWGLCMAAGRSKSDCYSGTGSELDKTIGWGLCMAAGQPKSECYSGTGNTYDETLEWGVCMASGGTKASCLKQIENRF